MTDGRVTQTGIEVTVTDTDPAARVTQTGIEVSVGDSDPEGRVTQTGLEVTHFHDQPDGRVTQTCLEVAVIARTIEPVGIPPGGGIGVPVVADVLAIQPESIPPDTHVGVPVLTRYESDTSTTLPPDADPDEPPHPCNNDYVVPVQQGSVRHLTVAISPAGRALFGWVDYTNNLFKCAVRESPMDVFTDDVVDASDVRVAFTPAAGRTIQVASLFVEGGDLFFVISDAKGAHPNGNGQVRCYIADDPENPVVWTLRSTMTNHTASDGLMGGSCVTGGVPLVLSSGRWVLPFQTWGTYVTALRDMVGLYTSDDRGVNWVRRIANRKGPLFSGTAGPPSTSVARDPVTGALVFGTHMGPVLDNFTYSSVDGGDSWSISSETGATKHFYADDGVNVYAVIRSGALGGDKRVIHRAINPNLVATWEPLCEAVEVSGVYNEEDGAYNIPLYLGGEFWDFAFTSGDRVGVYPRSGWLVDQIAIG